MATDDASTKALQWQAESLRFTGFLTGDVDVPGWWRAAVNEDPDKITTSKTGEQRAEGALQTGQLVLATGAGRLDWHFETPPTDKEGELLLLGQFDEVLKVFHDAIQRWLSHSVCGPLERLAFGAVLRSPVESREEGYRSLSAYLPSVTIDPLNSRDFSYQVNRRRRLSSADLDLEVNRLSKWSVAFIQVSGLLTAPSRLKVIPGRVLHACRLELDINTAPELEGTIDAAHYPTILKELVDLAVEISENGDMP